MITDREKTIVDALDLPQYTGGIGPVHATLLTSWSKINESCLREYASRIGNTAVAKRLGFLMETLGVGDPEALRQAVKLASGYSRLDPTLSSTGKHNRRWGLLINVKVSG